LSQADIIRESTGSDEILHPARQNTQQLLGVRGQAALSRQANPRTLVSRAMVSPAADEQSMGDDALLHLDANGSSVLAATMPVMRNSWRLNAACPRTPSQLLRILPRRVQISSLPDFRGLCLPGTGASMALPARWP